MYIRRICVHYKSNNFFRYRFPVDPSNNISILRFVNVNECNVLNRFRLDLTFFAGNCGNKQLSLSLSLLDEEELRDYARMIANDVIIR